MSEKLKTIFLIEWFCVNVLNHLKSFKNEKHVQKILYHSENTKLIIVQYY